MKKAYKLSLCNHWLEGRCSKDSSTCNYAHGELDLRCIWAHIPATRYKGEFWKHKFSGFISKTPPLEWAEFQQAKQVELLRTQEASQREQAQQQKIAQAHQEAKAAEREAWEQKRKAREKAIPESSRRSERKAATGGPRKLTAEGSHSGAAGSSNPFDCLCTTETEAEAAPVPSQGEAKKPKTKQKPSKARTSKSAQGARRWTVADLQDGIQRLQGAATWIHENGKLNTPYRLKAPPTLQLVNVENFNAEELFITLSDGAELLEAFIYKSSAAGSQAESGRVDKWALVQPKIVKLESDEPDHFSEYSDEYEIHEEYYESSCDMEVTLSIEDLIVVQTGKEVQNQTAHSDLPLLGCKELVDERGAPNEAYYCDLIDPDADLGDVQVKVVAGAQAAAGAQATSGGLVFGDLPAVLFGFEGGQAAAGRPQAAAASSNGRGVTEDSGRGVTEDSSRGSREHPQQQGFNFSAALSGLEAVRAAAETSQKTAGGGFNFSAALSGCTHQVKQAMSRASSMPGESAALLSSQRSAATNQKTKANPTQANTVESTSKAARRWTAADMLGGIARLQELAPQIHKDAMCRHSPYPQFYGLDRFDRPLILQVMRVQQHWKGWFSLALSDDAVWGECMVNVDSPAGELVQSGSAGAWAVVQPMLVTAVWFEGEISSTLVLEDLVVLQSSADSLCSQGPVLIGRKKLLDARGELNPVWRVDILDPDPNSHSSGAPAPPSHDEGSAAEASAHPEGAQEKKKKKKKKKKKAGSNEADEGDAAEGEPAKDSDSKAARADAQDVGCAAPGSSKAEGAGSPEGLGGQAAVKGQRPNSAQTGEPLSDNAENASCFGKLESLLKRVAQDPGDLALAGVAAEALAAAAVWVVEMDGNLHRTGVWPLLVLDAGEAGQRRLVGPVDSTGAAWRGKDGRWARWARAHAALLRGAYRPPPAAGGSGLQAPLAMTAVGLLMEPHGGRGERERWISAYGAELLLLEAEEVRHVAEWDLEEVAGGWLVGLAAEGCVDGVQRLLQWGTAAGGQKVGGETALHAAARGGTPAHLRVVELLVRQPKVDLLAPDAFGEAPGVGWEVTEAVRALLDPLQARERAKRDKKNKRRKEKRNRQKESQDAGEGGAAEDQGAGAGVREAGGDARAYAGGKSDKESDLETLVSTVLEELALGAHGMEEEEEFGAAVEDVRAEGGSAHLEEGEEPDAGREGRRADTEACGRREVALEAPSLTATGEGRARGGCPREGPAESWCPGGGPPGAGAAELGEESAEEEAVAEEEVDALADTGGGGQVALLQASLEGLPWECEITREARLQWDALDRPLALAVLRKVHELASGRQSSAKLVATEAGLRLRKSRFSAGGRVVWERAVAFSRRTEGVTEVLRIWAVVADHDRQAAAIRSITESHRKGALCHLKYRLRLLPAPRDVDGDGTVLALPRRAMPANATGEEGEVVEWYPPAAPGADAYVLLKFYEMSAALLSDLVRPAVLPPAEAAAPQADFAFRLSETEYRVMTLTPSPPAPVLLIGRSGTGKTTCTVYRMWARWQSFRQGELANGGGLLSGACGEAEASPFHQLFVTSNPVLREEVRRYFQGLARGQGLAAGPASPTLPPVAAAAASPVTLSAGEVPESAFPLFLTKREWLVALDGSVPEPFFERTAGRSAVLTAAATAHALGRTERAGMRALPGEDDSDSDDSGGEEEGPEDAY
ncbi:hypothetical protein CYMTET_42186 [Cymbomonas tetramitiformis]|uniref:C3H1-type domain-containing protein n=1 Tax=Cymbomonas tetramitiformis TaxID=36881 RepID=A0AAE0C5X4_9CHLO|nr:hypothetical protein CYMTET_42186 [Cymbomonas tetramitiformis]